MEMHFSWAGVDGMVRVEFGRNDDPAAFGCAEFARGFPYCLATIEPQAKGYAEMLGWAQLVDASFYTPGEFISDGFQRFGPLPHPFGYFGVSPTLFDAPHTDEENSDFLAHTFLCGLGGELLEFRREACPVLGFSWGFSKRGEEIRFIDPSPLPPEEWECHRDYLAETFDGWTFASGYRQHPLA
jgi:hypothetical protein